MRLLCLDFESVDPYLGLKLGPGWVYGVNVQNHLFKLIGFGCCWYNTETKITTDPIYFVDEFSGLQSMINYADGIIAHNCSYELGCLEFLGIKTWRDKDIYDTKVMAELYDNNIEETSLDYISKKYLPKEQQKSKYYLIDVVKKYNLLKSPKGKSRNHNSITYNREAEKYAYSHMDEIQLLEPEVMAEYCNADIRATINLFKLYSNTLSLEQVDYWSSINKLTVEDRIKGITVDMEVLHKNIPLMEKEVRILRIDLCIGIAAYAHEGYINYDPDSPKQLGEALRGLGYKLPKSIKGNDSTNAKWLKENEKDPLIKLIIDYRTAKKILNDFFIKVRDNMRYTCPEALCGAKYGKIYPVMQVFGARATGRFSSSSPNIQNIPQRHPKWGKLVRSMFVTNDLNKQWIKLDWKAQESRLQVHFAALINAPSANAWVTRYNEDPLLDQHQQTADLAGITRSQAKPINLGISYGMQSGSLAKNLGLPTKWVTSRNGYKFEVADKEAEEILDKYHKGVPYIQYLIDTAKNSIKSKGYIITIGRRQLKRSADGRDYTGISKLIQGSAADCMYKAYKDAKEIGLDIKCIVHDEFNIEGTYEDAKKMKEIMENVYPLVVPFYADVSVGKNWGELEEIKDKIKLDG